MMKTLILLCALLGVHAAQAAEVTMNEQTETEKRTEKGVMEQAPATATVAVVELKKVPPIRLEPKADPVERYRAGIADATGDVRNAEAGFQYTYILPGDYSEAALQAHRQVLVDEGWKPRTGPYAKTPGTEYVASKGDVEIWRRPAAVANADHLDRLATCVASPEWFRQYLRHERDQLPEPVKLAAMVYHKLQDPPAGKTVPTLEQLRASVFKHVKPHPGTPKKQLADWG